MPLKDTALMLMTGERMRWLTQRQRVLAQNVANADTPGYAAQDLRALDFRSALRETQSNLRLAGVKGESFAAGTDRDAFRVQQHRFPYEITPDDNHVNLEEQVLKLNQTQGDYQLATQIFRKYGQLYTLALGRNQT